MIVTDLAVRHRTTVYVLMVLIVIVGAWSYVAMPRESSPDIKIPFMNIVTLYPGVAPGDVETLLTIPIENELKNLRDVEKVTSVSAEGVSVITIEFQPSVDLDFALQRVKEKVDAAKTDLPPDAEDPLVQEINFSDFPIMQVNVTGDVGLVRLKQIADDLQDRIEGIQGVLRVEVVGGQEREIHVEFDPERLAGYGLAPQAVAAAIQAANVNVPGGNLELGEANYSLRVPGEFEDPQEIAALVVSRSGGRPVYVRDVATVVDGHKDVETLSRYNGVPSVSLSIQKRAGENIVRICDEVRRLLAAERGRLPAGVELPLAFDESRNIRRMVADLENSMANGFVLVVGVILFFMGLTNSVFVGLAIPFSMLISFGVLHAMGYSLNIIVLFALILSLGMLVDNAIVIVDNIYRHMQMGKARIQAAMDGTAEVAWPVTTSTLTTVAAFFPMLFWPGIMGEFMSYLPATLIVTLTASLFVALVVNPVLCASFMKVHAKRMHAPGGRENFFLRGYERLLTFSVDRHKTSIALGFASLVAIIALFGKFGRGVEFFPAIEPTRAQITVKTARGTSLATTDLVTRRAEEATKCCENVDYVIADVGAGGGGFFVGEGSASSDAARVSVYFRPWEKLVEPASRTLERIRAAVDKEIVGAEVIVDKEQHGPPTGPPVNLEISGEDFDSLKGVADRVRAAIKDVPGVVGLEDDYDQGRPEIRVRVDKERAELLGTTTIEVALAVRAAVNGVKAGVFREGDEEYDITVRLPKSQRSSIDALRHMTLAGRGGQVPLSAVARLEMGGGFGSIRRIDQKRVVTVSADVQGRLPEQVRADVAAAVARLPLPPKTAIGFTGEQQEQAKNQRFLGQVFVVALLLISLILVAQFDSLKYVLIIMLTVPLSLLGVFLGLLATNTTFIVIMTGIGVISLAGVVVNNAIVLLDFVRSARRGGMPVREALIASGKVRLRPVFLTAVTTILGLAPMATGVDFDFRSLSVITNSESSQWWKAMSIAVIFGLAVATVLTLVMVPTFYRAFFGLGERKAPPPATPSLGQCSGRAATFLCGCAVAIATLVLPGRAAADPPAAATLEEVVRATLASEESLRIVTAEARKAEQRTKRYFSSLTPDLRLQGSYGWSDEEDAAADEKAAARDRYGWGFVLTQPLYTGGRATAAYRGQQHLEASARLQVELAGRSLTVAAAQAYYRVLGAGAAVDIGEKAIELARRQFARATRRVELGEAVLNDQLRAEVTLRGLEAELAGARSTLAQAREDVRRLSGLELAASPAVPPPLPRVAGSDEALVAEALAARREPEQARLAVSAAEEDVREKKGRFLPSLALRAAYGEDGDELSDRPWAWSAGVVLEMPIYQGGATTYELRESRLGLEQQRLRAAGTSRDIEREVRNLLREIEAARSAVQSLDLGVAASAENLRLAERRYEVGLADSIEVADAQRADVAARVGFVVARYRLEALTLQLLGALGRDLAVGLATPARP